MSKEERDNGSSKPVKGGVILNTEADLNSRKDPVHWRSDLGNPADDSLCDVNRG